MKCAFKALANMFVQPGGRGGGGCGWASAEVQRLDMISLRQSTSAEHKLIIVRIVKRNFV